MLCSFLFVSHFHEILFHFPGMDEIATSTLRKTKQATDPKIKQRQTGVMKLLSILSHLHTM